MMAGDPIATGLITNLARPDGNLTGLSGAAAELAAKSLELIPEIVTCKRRASAEPWRRRSCSSFASLNASP